MPKKLIPKLKVEKEMYAQALSDNMSFDAFLAKMEQEQGYVPPHGSDFANMSALERQLMAHGIRVSGAEVSMADAFYQTGTSGTALFPAYINTQIRLGMEAVRNECSLADLVANTVTIDSNSYTASAVTIAAAEVGAHRVAEGAAFPVITITDSEQSVKLKKYGHEFRMSNEVLRRKTIDQLKVHLLIIGKRMARSMVSEAIDVLVLGDGNTNPITTTTATGLTYDNLVDFDFVFDNFEPTVYVALKAGVATLVKLTEFKDPQAGFNYQATGKLISPLGVTLRRQSTVPADTLLAVDKAFSLEQINERNSSLVEVDSIINRQLKTAVISQNTGFAIIYRAASQAWDYS